VDVLEPITSEEQLHGLTGEFVVLTRTTDYFADRQFAEIGT
jgi:hypothetical protein